ncbi:MULTISPECIES: antibiotic biosynthesis monooxygenase [unclassified Lentimicrobium]|uniref:antibiotic biosynthesis monooxygenase family protein n=1 Tax=unclassified Lentimicrobium TaxID=2677434 RepID=UPI001557D084|nr:MULTISPECIES: antibiotic biosynthesis monooxygenase [unclassified Lentimicrobium]NPD45438.1 antibiotic biosynthesis monooxygenase [Lentimicrobium sp. S6]NPD83800.1 antibiotic biosynthesis monooxygenase [Lentimicrobium sp. L6]
MIAKTHQPPYYAVIFTSIMNASTDGYEIMANKMLELAEKQDGFLGIESAREEIGITVSYWKDEESIKNWKLQTDHIIAQKLGKEKWYESYRIRVCKVERDYTNLK